MRTILLGSRVKHVRGQYNDGETSSTLNNKVEGTIVSTYGYEGYFYFLILLDNGFLIRDIWYNCKILGRTPKAQNAINKFQLMDIEE